METRNRRKRKYEEKIQDTLTVGGWVLRNLCRRLARFLHFSDSRAEKDCSESRKKYLTGYLCETSYLPEAKYSISHLCSLFKESSTFSHMLHFCISFVFFNNKKNYEFNDIYIDYKCHSN